MREIVRLVTEVKYPSVRAKIPYIVAVWILVSRQFKRAWTEFKAMSGQFCDAGAAILQGLWNGLKSKAAAVMAPYVREVASQIASAFRSVLDIHSPSRVFMRYGEHIAAGAALGMHRGLPQIQKASRVMATATVSTYGPVAMPTRAGSFGPGGGLVVTLNQTNNFLGGGPELAAQAKDAMGDAYRQFEAMMRQYEREPARRSLG